MKLIYVMDPMCSWCYAFQPELEALLEKYPSASLEWVMGGLAPDSNQVMDEALQQSIAAYWRHIETQTQVSFNHDFWALNTPYRSTYPACRAVLSAQQLKTDSAADMVKAIQDAYYQQAKNPSLAATLIECAVSMGIEASDFENALHSEQTETEFQQHLALTQHLQIGGFPALFYIDDSSFVAERKQAHPIALGYSPSKDLINRLERALQN